MHRHTGQPYPSSESSSSASIESTVARQPPLPWVDVLRVVTIERHARVPSPPLFASSVQLTLFAPSVLRRVVLRRRRSFVFMSIRGEIERRYMTEAVPCAIPTSADDAGLVPEGRWTPPRHSRDFDRLSYQDDFAVRMFVRDHQEGASLEEIADEIGFTKQGVNEVLIRAVRKLVERAKVDADTREWMAGILGTDVEDIERRLACRES